MSLLPKILTPNFRSSVANGSAKMSTPAQVGAFLNVLKQYKVKEIDTARVYNGGKSEELLGAVGAGTKLGFAVSTKAPGFSPGVLSGEKIKKACYASLEALKQDKMDIFYFHGPDRETPLEEQCKAANELYQERKFERFGVSNHLVGEVQTIYDICKKKGYVLPTVYQGGYNPLMRSADELLFPTLRKLGISFYAFSPLGGGYFTRTADQLRNPAQDQRMAAFPVFKEIYVSEKSLEWLEELTKVCEDNGTTPKEGVLRWFMHHSILEAEDGVILGASDEKQVDETLKACEMGPLPELVVRAFNDLWEKNKDSSWKYA
jgi:aflatoxin B1 aldehyde reductase